MRTTKPISTISFNSVEHLKMTLENLTKARKISFWAFIPHKPEDDEAGKKHHAHVYIEPSVLLQTDDIKEAFKEYDPEKPDKPKGCLTFLTSKFADWYLYSIHDRRYLASKGQSRKFHYKHEDFVSSDPDDLLFKVRSIDLLSLSRYADMLDAIENGLLWEEYFMRGTVPLNLVAQTKLAWDALMQASTHRNGRQNHPMEED